MRVFTPAELQAVIESLPDTPDNQGAYQALMEMMREQQIIEQPYVFEVDFVGAGGTPGVFAAPGPAAQVAGSFLVDTSSPFMLVSTTYKADVAAAAQNAGNTIVPNATVFIQDQSSNRSWMNIAVPIPSLFGTASLPYFWPKPRLIPGNTNVAVTVTSFEAAVTNNIRLSFHGYRLYSTKN